MVIILILIFLRAIRRRRRIPRGSWTRSGLGKTAVLRRPARHDCFDCERLSCRFERVERAGGVPYGRAGVDADADAQSFGDLLFGGAELLCCCRMNGDAAVAV